MDKMILKDATEITLAAGSGLSNMMADFKDRASMLAAWEKMTPDNLSAAQIKTETGLLVAGYKDLCLVSETSVVKQDGTVSTSFHLREKTEEEKRLDALETGQAVQDAAISDLGEATSMLAEGTVL